MPSNSWELDLNSPLSFQKDFLNLGGRGGFAKKSNFQVINKRKYKYIIYISNKQ